MFEVGQEVACHDYGPAQWISVICRETKRQVFVKSPYSDREIAFWKKDNREVGGMGYIRLATDADREVMKRREFITRLGRIHWHARPGYPTATLEAICRLLDEAAEGEGVEG